MPHCDVSVHSLPDLLCLPSKLQSTVRFVSAVSYMGKNSLEGASQQIKDLGLKNALIVTDGVSALPI